MMYFCREHGMMEYWGVGILGKKTEKIIFYYFSSSPSLSEFVLNKVEKDKFTHHSSIPLFQHSN